MLTNNNISASNAEMDQMYNTESADEETEEQ